MSGKLTRRTVLGGLMAAPFVRTANAQADWPNRPVRVMVPYPPAGGADTTARILYAKVGAILKQQFVIENRGGAGGTIGEALVAKANPDGYTILHDATAYSVNGALYSNLSFDYSSDFDAVALVSYPNRQAFIDMVSTPAYNEAHTHREDGLERTVVIACAPMPAATEG